MEEKTFVLRRNSEEIREKIENVGIPMCLCSSFKGADWLAFHTSIGDKVHGIGYPMEEELMGGEEVKALFVKETKKPIWCDDVDTFIDLISDFLRSKRCV